MQRITAVYVALYLVMATLYALCITAASYSAWLAWLQKPFYSIATGLFVLAVLLHAWIGVRDVILDYVKPFMIRMLILTLIAVVLMGSGLWILKAMLWVYFV